MAVTYITNYGMILCEYPIRMLYLVLTGRFMFEYLKFAFQLLSDTIRERHLSQLFHQQIFYKRVAIPVVIDLVDLEFKKDPLLGLDYRFVELNRQDIEAKKWTFLVINRQFDALRHIKQGLRGFALVKANDVVVGDIWCITPDNQKTTIHHPDLKMLGISASDGDVYALDMFIPADYRGKKLAVPLHRSLQAILRQEGWQKLYAYYWEDNLPSRWTHWMLKCHELPKVRVSRFFSFKKTYPVS